MRRIVSSGLAAFALACTAAYPQQSTASSVYALVAPAVVFVQAGTGSGSGLLLNSNTILTAAHVLYPHRSARIAFPDGTELLDVPLIAWNLLTDIALLGPVGLDSPPATPPFDTSNSLPLGADLFTIGYPGEVEPFPQPTISRGILSRYRLWPDQDITFLQSDATVDGGQSGGVLVSASGAVVGMTGFAWGRRPFRFGHLRRQLPAPGNRTARRRRCSGTPRRSRPRCVRATHTLTVRSELPLGRTGLRHRCPSLTTR